MKASIIRRQIAVVEAQGTTETSKLRLRRGRRHKHENFPNASIAQRRWSGGLCRGLLYWTLRERGEEEREA